MRITAKGKRLFSSLMAGSLMLGIMVPGSYAQEIPSEIQRTSSEIATLTDGETLPEAQSGNESVTSAVYATPSQPGALLITELVPDTKNVGSADSYEYVEVYNNTDTSVNFNDYYFYYNGANTWTTGGDTVIPAFGNIVFWIMNGTNQAATANDFIANFSPEASLQEGVNLFRINGGGGMANGSPRNLQIKSKAGDALIISASYAKEQVKENNGIVYQYPVTGGTEMVLMSEAGIIPATPGTVTAGQIPEHDPGEMTPVISHTPKSSTDPADLVINATITHLQNADVEVAPAVELLYRTTSQLRETVITMTSAGGEAYSAVIPAAALEEPELIYSIRVKNVTESYSVHVNQPDFNSALVPPLLVTELLPNSSNAAGTTSDAFEFIEVYNNTDKPVDFKNYKLFYRYPDKGNAADVKWPSTQESLNIPAQQSVVFWVINSANAAYKASDFNTAFNTDLVEGTNLFLIKSDGMSNSGRRGIVIKSNTEKEISAAYYDADTLYNGGTKGDETKESKSLQYKYPVNGTGKMLKISSGEAVPSPGSADLAQVPVTPVHVELDTEAPEVNDLTDISEIDQSGSLDLKAFADDNKGVTSVEVRVASDKQPDFVSHNLAQDYNDNLYHFKLSSAELIGRTEIQYYFVVSDGSQETESPLAKVKITGGPDRSPLRLNVKDNALLHGSVTVKGTAASAEADELVLSIDGKETDDTQVYPALENDAYFVFDAKNVDYYFKNGITMGPEELGDKSILYTFMDPITSYTTLSFPISAAALKAGTDNVIYIRAGSKSSPFDPRPEENKDDFEIKNVRLLLADGTEVWDPAYSARDKEIKMGDSTGKNPSIGFRFELQSEQLRSKAYDWNTAQATDGSHTLILAHGQEQVKSKVIVDNTPPTIQSNMEEGQTYRGSIELKADVTDEYAGVDQVSVKLDDTEIELPYATSSGMLAGGVHNLSITATDKAGNKAEKLITFKVPEENPYAPQVIAPINGAKGVGTSPKLTVKVEDPTGDKLDVSFYQGFKYDGSHPEQGFTGFKNASDTEPPKQPVPAGEQALSGEEYRRISAADGDYLVNDAVEQFPYQRYEIKLDESVKATDRVDVEWKGNSLPGRKVSLYAWSPSGQNWVLLDHQIAGTTDFELKSTVSAGVYRDGDKIAVMVQDEIAAAAASTVTQDTYDFSFVWMSDTQYYSQSYPYIYQKNVQWIADNKDSLNLKYVIHTGDVVDKSYQEYEWEEADKDMRVLEDAGIPYGVLAGNHDVGHQNGDYTKFWEYFGEWRFKNLPTYGGSYDNNRGHYDLVSAGGNDFIIVYMGWGLAEQEIEWMNEVVARYPERKAILCLHEYMLVSNNRAPIADTIFEKVVKPNKNVIAALSGHYHDAELKVDPLDDNGDGVADRNVYQMLADYQGAEQGGLGYIRLLQFDIANNQLHVKTYSPFLDDYNFYDEVEFPGKDEFSLPLDLQPVTKRVATDYIGVKVYSDQKIAVKQVVASGSEVTVPWNNLNQDSYYQWYTKVEDGNTGSVLSDIWGFYTGKEGVAPTPTPTPAPEGTDPWPVGTTGPAATPAPSVTPSPAAVPGADKGSIKLVMGQDGNYSASLKDFETLIRETIDGTIRIALTESGVSQGIIQLALDAKGVEQAVQNKKALKIVSSGFELAIPAESLPDIPEGSDKVLLSIHTVLTPQLQQTIEENRKGTAGLGAPQAGVTLELKTVSGGKETAVHQFKNSVTVTLMLTAGEFGGIDKDYAGVYYLDGSSLKYMGGIFKNNTVSFTTDHFSSYAIMEYHKVFSDVSGSWSEQYINKLAAKHIITGIDENHYAPTWNVTRADFAVLAVRAMNLNNTAGAPAVGSFADVPQGAYYASSVEKAAELGFMEGSEGRFRPDDTITREEAAVVLSRLMKSGASAQSPASAAGNAVFADTGSISLWAKEAVSELQAKGLISGKGNNQFDPRGEVTRAETAKLLYGLLNL
ncbi:S-layer homology domain-containing protein [Paenibacillus sp. FSL R7-0297]|uniref:S-layer homology domain-containing protein n=1 Tax=Paenibacillus sp. FSL R7-0297 TaxID=2921680 RepID=UPI0030F91904